MLPDRFRGNVNVGFFACLLAGAVGCFFAKGDDGTDTSGFSAGNETAKAALASTVILDSGCTAAKVGPRHLLVAAGCVVENPSLTPKSVLKLVTAASGQHPGAPSAGPSTGTNAGSKTGSDSGSGGAATPAAGGGNPAGAGSGTPGGTKPQAVMPPASSGSAAPAKPPSSAPPRQQPPATTSDLLEVHVASINVPDSYRTNCKGGACAIGRGGESDAADLAVVVLDQDLTSVPTVPVDLDPVGEADPVLVIASGCASVDGTPGDADAIESSSVPVKAVMHGGSPYDKQPNLVTQLAGSYFVTAGTGWQPQDAPGICKRDVGGPVFRSETAAVVGVTAAYTLWAPNRLTPVTLQHTRVDERSRFKMGDWLTKLGVKTVHSCSTSSDGCPKHTFSGEGPGGTPLAGGEGTADLDPPARIGRAHQVPMPNEGESLPSGSGTDYDASAASAKKATKSGCSSAPGAAPVGEAGFGVAIGLGLAAIRRRRRASSPDARDRG